VDRALTIARIIDDSLEASHADVHSVVEKLPATGVDPDRGWSARPISSRPNLAVAYFISKDDLRVVDTNLMRDYESPPGVDQNGAREIFYNSFDALASAGLVDRSNYDPSRHHVGYTKHGSGSEVNGVVSETEPKISEFHFRVRRLLEGIEFANELTKISVHVTGKISSIRIVGAEVGAKTGEAAASLVSTEDAKARFSLEYPHAIAEWEQLLYSFQGDAQSGTIEPRHVISFSNVSISDEQPVVSRRQEVRYSAISMAAPPDLWPIAKPNATGDEVTLDRVRGDNSK
jgi:hypothetical protein